MTLLLHSTINKYIASISVIIAWESVSYAGQVRIQLFRKLLEAKVSEEHYFLNIIHIYYAKWKNVRVVLNSLDCDMSFSYVYRDVNQFSNKFERIQEPCTSLDAWFDASNCFLSAICARWHCSWWLRIYTHLCVICALQFLFLFRFT